jgi:3-oxoadipate enol-lactonase
MPTVRANGIEFNYVVEGPEDAPWITFSNSLATDVTMWDDQAALLSNDWRVLRYDQRGHGGTEATKPPYSFDLLVSDAIALWDALGVRRSVFCGLSMGGTTGLGLAIGHGDRLRALIACDCRCDSPPGFRDAWDQRIAMAKEKGMAGMADPTVSRWFNESFLTEGRATCDKVRGMVGSTKLDGFIGCSNALQNIAYREALPAIAVPTLFIAGAQDPAANPDYIGPMKDVVPGARMAVIDPAGHISNMENPKQFNAALTGFLARL